MTQPRPQAKPTTAPKDPLDGPPQEQLASARLRIAELETRLRASHERYRLLYENIPAMYFTLGPDGTVRSVNSYGAQYLGYTPEELTGRPVLHVFHEDDRIAVSEQLRACLDQPGSIACWDFRKVRKDGTVLWVQEFARAVESQGETVVLVVCEDVTARKQAELKLIEHRRKLRALASQLVSVEERERRHIAVDLHDQIGQSLAMVKLGLAKLLTERSLHECSEEIREARRLVDQAIRETRSLTFQLSSPVLYELGLEPALQTLGESMLEPVGIRFHFGTDERARSIAGDTRVFLYRAARELLMNVVKHSQARNTKLTVRKAGKRLRIEVADDGVGFDATGAGSAVGASEGFGLFSIRERMDHLGGTLEIDSTPGRGTRVTIVAPIE